jgi:hypothetical protein
MNGPCVTGAAYAGELVSTSPNPARTAVYYHCTVTSVA